MTTLSQNLLDLSDFAWQRLRNRVEGMTDDEYFWEPFDGCWSVRETADGYAADWAWIPPAPPPFTTLAWRITHIADLLQAERTATWFGHEPAATDAALEVPGSAAAALAALDRAYDIWRRRLAALSQEDLDRPMGEIAGPYAESDGTSFALHILDELIHHGAEVGTVRDFYRGAHPEDPFAAALAGELTPTDRPALLAEAAAAQRWEVVPTLADLGFSVNEQTPDGATAAHLAAGTGSLDTLRFLVERGADLSLTDRQFNADVRGWAQWFKQADVAEYLATVRSAPETR
ncbi:ankyrin repeat protein [Kribbella sp. VKM Ac-2571]|uniref:DinB family protein n=1 Tax=Kribbella sp. VKM Ac-2571 TaxID=2512222 RepID=UPI00105EB7CE|nr:DinB family protein [Kribbella sp. VKM Ac-2571]TDO52075.1 ankyrin repeat protein [Kribbella sp. VKM Ac-2571]